MNKNKGKTKRNDKGLFIAIGTNEKMGKKNFYFRLPQEYQDKLNNLTQQERVVLVRDSVIKGIDNLENV